MRDEQEIGQRVKSGIIGAIRGTGEITTAAIGTIADVVQSAVKETADTGATVGSVAVGAAKGAISAVGEVGVTAADTTEHTVSRAAQSASKMGVSVGNAAKGAVIGSLRGTA